MAQRRKGRKEKQAKKEVRYQETSQNVFGLLACQPASLLALQFNTVRPHHFHGLV
jgi:hypothetical protein